MSRIAVIGANAPLEPFYRRARRLGHYIIGIAWEDGAVCKEYCDKFYPISFTQKEKVLEVCRNEHIDGILSFSLESALPTVTFVAQSMGLVSNSYECLEKTMSKFAQREAFRQNGIKVPAYHLVKDPSELSSVRIEFPVIVKPSDSGGSQGVTKIDEISDLRTAYEYARKYSRTSSVIVEEYVDGREFSVEHISHDGIHYLVQITDKVTSGPPHFIEMQHHQPADISDELRVHISDTVSKALDALKIENSVSHTELKLNSRGELRIIEIGARMGGDHITSDLVYLSTGYDFVEGAIELAVGKFEPPVFKYSKNSGIYFYSRLAPEIGDFIRRSRNYPEIVESRLNGDELPEVCSNADRCGYLIYQTEHGRFNL